MTLAPLTLDWGIATADSVNDDRRIVAHIFNHELGTPECVKKNVRFARARVAWFSTQLPQGFEQVVVFDDRGQNLHPSVREELKKQLATTAVRIAFFSEGLRGVV